MKKVLCFLILSGILMAFDMNAQKVLLYIEDGSSNLQYMLVHEAGMMKSILENSGFKVDVATIDGSVLKTDSTTLTPDMKLSDVKISDYVGFIMPCMATEDTVITQTETDFVKTALKENKPIAAQLGAIMILAKAGVLEGKRFAIAKEMKDSPAFANAYYSGEGIVQDGNIVTSGICPNLARVTNQKDGTEVLTKTLVAMIKEKK